MTASEIHDMAGMPSKVQMAGRAVLVFFGGKGGEGSKRMDTMKKGDEEHQTGERGGTMAPHLSRFSEEST